jgi:predicted HAD superfamily phosphohydrolase YqeG
LIKIDVESHEPEVLEGMENYLEEMRPTFLIKILNNNIAAKVQSFLKNIDYLYFRVDDSGIMKPADISIEINYCNNPICQASIAKRLNSV